MTVVSFAPIADSGCHTLVLGSAPSRRSLELQQYYGHPRNAFWPIMARLIGFDPDAPYRERAAAFAAAGLALWDVMASCERATSMDADIVDTSIVPHDFAGFFADHPSLRRVYFNGSKAESSYRRHVLPRLDGRGSRVPTTRLPSTSPANASWTFERKLEAWAAVVEPIG